MKSNNQVCKKMHNSILSKSELPIQMNSGGLNDKSSNQQSTGIRERNDKLFRY